MTARPGTLTAIIGGSGAGKSTLARLIAGYTRPSSGSVTFEGHDIHAEYASLRSRIGMVPQDDVVHRQLTVNQALGYAAELRLPPDTSKSDRARVVAQVLEELDLTKHADTRVDKLSGGQRKRASVALELLTGPSLLILDEPTSGLDPALDHQVMLMLRQLADAGRVVIVVTHMLSYLDMCDQLLLVAPGGKTAYYGPPDQIGAAMGTTNWAKIFTKVGADPEEANRRFLAQAEAEKQPQKLLPDKDVEKGDLGKPVHTSMRRQISTISRRQVRLVVADRAYFIFLALLPFILGVLSLTVPGSNGFHLPMPHSGVPDESVQILNLLLPAAAFMGTALTIRDLVGERAIFQREQAVGLSTSAYLLAKTAVYCGFAFVQSAIITTIVVIGKSAPARGGTVFGHGNVAATAELFLAVAGTCVASAVLGLVISSLVRSSEQIMPLFVVSVMAQLVLCGGMVPVTGRHRPRPVIRFHARALGVRRGGVDDRPAHPGARRRGPPRPVLGTHDQDLAARYGHAGRAFAVLSGLCAVEDPAAPVTPSTPPRHINHAHDTPRWACAVYISRRLTPFIRPSTRRSIWSLAPTPIPRALCGPSTSTRCTRGGSTWPGPRPAGPSSITCESWLLPSLGLRATIFHFNPGHERDQDYYLDVGEYTPGPQVWESEDHYLDIVVRTGTGAELADVDELLDAARLGLVTPDVAERAVRRAVDTIDGLARNDYDLTRWLGGQGIELTWRGA